LYIRLLVFYRTPRRAGQVIIELEYGVAHTDTDTDKQSYNSGGAKNFNTCAMSFRGWGVGGRGLGAGFSVFGFWELS